MAPPIVTLTTDFGTADGYAAAMKGVLYGINPDARLVDISHDVPPQDIRGAAFVLGSTHRYFPPGTIHLVVVDPSVGTGRRPVVVAGPNASYVCPDNGLLSYVYAAAGGPTPEAATFEEALVGLPSGWSAYRLTNAAYWHHPVSATFHGRDIFAPVAAHLSAGVEPSAMGEPIERVTTLAIPRPERREARCMGACYTWTTTGTWSPTSMLITRWPWGLGWSSRLQASASRASLPATKPASPTRRSSAATAT